MLKSLVVKNFRLLGDLQVSGLGNLNLVVGKNNSGKSSFLEALRVLCRRGQPSLLQELVAGRDETTASRLVGEDDRFADVSPYRHLFRGRAFPRADGQGIEISDPISGQFVSIEHVLYRVREDTGSDPAGDVTLVRKRELLPKANSDSWSEGQQALSIKSDVGATFWSLEPGEDLDRIRRLRLNMFEREPAPVSFLSTRFLHPDRIATLWDQAVLTNAEDDILNGLRLIEPGVQGLAFVKADELDRERYPTNARLREEKALRGERIALVKMAGSVRPIPLSSMGDGMLRVLQLLLAMYPAKGGYFLVDEFENGLHHSVQLGLWRLLFDLSQRMDIQVIATTHSNDCISAFAAVAKSRLESTGSLFRLKRVDDEGGDRIVVTTFSEEQLLLAQQTDIDLR
jgi:predicted ATPase